MSLRKGFGVGFRGGGGGVVGRGWEGGVGTGKGTGKSMRTHLSKLPFSNLPFSFSPIESGNSALVIGF